MWRAIDEMEWVIEWRCIRWHWVGGWLADMAGQLAAVAVVGLAAVAAAGLVAAAGMDAVAGQAAVAVASLAAAAYGASRHSERNLAVRHSDSA